MKTRYEHHFSLIAIVVAIAYWLFDSIIHLFVFGELEFELIPSETNELWMRCMIFFLLVFFGIYADFQTNKLKVSERKKIEVYETMIKATHHILNNYLNRMMLFRLEAEKSNDFDPNVLAKYEETIDETVKQIKKLENIDDPDAKTIEKRLNPN